MVTDPLQFKLLPLTLHGAEHVYTEPSEQSSSHPVTAWLVSLSFVGLSSIWLWLAS